MDLGILKEAARSCGGTVREDFLFSEHTTFHIGGKAALAVTLPCDAVLPDLLAVCRREGIPWMVLGNGSNLLVSDDGYAGAVFLLPDGDAAVCGNTVTVPAGAPLKTLCRAARDAGLAGIEFAYGIPGTVGGALYMNGGAYGGEMANVVTEAVVADTDGLHTVPVADMALGYRHSVFMERDAVIVSVTVSLTPDDPAAIGARMDELMARRREKQPLEFPSAGSYFKRPEGHFAGALIEQCGLKGVRVGDAQVSEKHAGFLINRGHATCADMLALEAQVRETVQKAFGVTLEREVRYIGG